MLQYIVRRFLLLIPTLIAISIISFVIIQLPPGDFLTAYIGQLRNTGTEVDESEIAALRQRYGLDTPIYVQYVKWMWGVLHGDFGMSFLWNKPVSELIGERLALTVAISLVTLMFTWIVAFPIGIYSATHQYSIGDYVFTALGFIGRGVPDFMIALILMWIALSQLRRQRWRPLFAGVSRSALEHGQALGLAQASLGADHRARAGRHGRADPHHARQPAGRAAQALCDHRPRQGADGRAAALEVPGARGAEPLRQHRRLVAARPDLRRDDHLGGAEPADDRAAAAGRADLSRTCTWQAALCSF